MERSIAHGKTSEFARAGVSVSAAVSERLHDGAAGDMLRAATAVFRGDRLRSSRPLRVGVVEVAPPVLRAYRRRQHTVELV